MPQPQVDALHRAFAGEDATGALAAIASALRAAGHLTEFEQSAVATATAEVRFAVAIAALRSRAPIEASDLAAAATLWGECAQDQVQEPEQLIVELAENRRVAILPLLDDLATSGVPCMVELAVEGYAGLANVSRSGTSAAVDGLLRIAAALAHDPRHDTQAARRALVPILAALTGVDADHRVADALAALAMADPGSWIAGPIFRPPPVSPTHYANDLCADAAAVLLAVGDPSWLTLTTHALASAGHDKMLMGRRASSASSLLSVLSGAAQPRDPRPAPYSRAALDLVRDLLARLPSQSQYLLPILLGWPQHEVRKLTLELVACLPFAPRQASQALAAGRASEAVAPLRAHLDSVGEGASWLHAALGAITGDATAFERGWAVRPAHFYFENEYLAMWRASPSPAFEAACRGKLTGQAQASFPERETQLLAARVIAPIDGVAVVWPTVRAILDKGGDSLAQAVTLAIALAPSMNATMRADLVNLLDDIRVAGRTSFPGWDDGDAKVEAARGLVALGHEAPVDATFLDVLRAAEEGRPQRTRTIQVACELLAELGRSEANLREFVIAQLRRLIDSDTRLIIRTPDGAVGADETCLRAFRAAKRALQA